VRPKQEGAGLNAGTRFGPLDRKSRQPYVDSASLCASQAADKPLRKAKGRILHNCREIALSPLIWAVSEATGAGIDPGLSVTIYPGLEAAQPA